LKIPPNIVPNLAPSGNLAS